MWIPRYRYAVLNSGVKEYLKIKLEEVRKHYPEIEYLEINIQPDHVRLPTSFPPKYSVSQVVGIIKQNIGQAMKDKFDFLKERYYGRGGILPVGYFASTVGLDETMRNYIKNQEKKT